MSEPFEVRCINCDHPMLVQFPDQAEATRSALLAARAAVENAHVGYYEHVTGSPLINLVDQETALAAIDALIAEAADKP